MEYAEVYAARVAAYAVADVQETADQAYARVYREAYAEVVAEDD